MYDGRESKKILLYKVWKKVCRHSKIFEDMYLTGFGGTGKLLKEREFLNVLFRVVIL